MRGLLARLRLDGPLWRNGDFLRLWSGQTISQFGSQISGLALPLLAILVLDASAFEVAALGVAEFLPFILFSLPAGAWVDRLRRRPILIVADWGRGVALASVPVAYLLDSLAMTQLYIVGFVVGGFTVFFDVAYQSFLPSLVAREELTDANGKLEVSRSAAQTGGPGVAGLLVGVLSAPYAILVDAISFVASALFVSSIRLTESIEPAANGERERLRTEIADGLRFVLKHPIMRPSLVGLRRARELLQQHRIFGLPRIRRPRPRFVANGHRSNRLYRKRWIARRRDHRSASRDAVWCRPGLNSRGCNKRLLTVAHPSSERTPGDPLLVASGGIFGFCAVVYNVVGISLMQAITPDRMLGRMTASRRFVVFGVIPLGMLAGGTLGTNMGLRETMWIGAVGSSLCFLALLASPIRRIRTVADAERLVGVEPV